TSSRWTWPGTNWVKLLATATIGLPKSSRATPLALMRARAPAMFLPWVTVRDLSGGMCDLPKLGRDVGRSRGVGAVGRVLAGAERGAAAGSGGVARGPARSADGPKRTCAQA